MRKGAGRWAAIVVMAVGLAGCNVTGKDAPDAFGFKDAGSGTDAFAAATPADTAAPFGEPAPESGLLGSNPHDDLSTGKGYFRAGNFGMAERYFRRATELHPQDAEAWLDLGASYDRLRRFDLADRAYAQAIRLVGAKVEILNNQGYSYMLRGDAARAYEKLTEARRRDPGNRYVLSNLRLLEDSTRQGKAIE